MKALLEECNYFRKMLDKNKQKKVEALGPSPEKLQIGGVQIQNVSKR